MADINSIVINQGLSALAGLFGGISISFFWQPKKLHQHGSFIAGIITGSISMFAAFALVGMAANFLHFNLNEADAALGLGYIVGAISIGILAAVANFFSRHEQDDIFEMASEIKHKIHDHNLIPATTRKGIEEEGRHEH